jgi:acyl carrier protein
MSDAAAHRSAEETDTRRRVERLLYEAVDEVNLGLAEHDRLQKSPEVVLAGDAGRLDSLGLINFIVAAEKRLQAEFQADLSLTEVITSQDTGRHLTLGSLCGTVTGMVERRRGGP